MFQDIKVVFKENLWGFHPHGEIIDLLNDETQNHAFPVSALVKDNEDKTMFQIQLRSEFPGAFFRDTTIVKNNLVIAIENQIYFFNLKSKETKQFRLKGYFDHFQFEQNYLFVLTNTHISCFSIDLNELWISDKLGVEKVNIKTIDSGFIIGTGKWEDDKGIVEFKIPLDSGKTSNPKKNNKGRSFLHLSWPLFN